MKKIASQDEKIASQDEKIADTLPLRRFTASLQQAKQLTRTESNSQWRQIESDTLEEKVCKAVCQKLDEGTGKIILTSYEWKGTVGYLDGLVIGNLEGHPIYVLVEAKHNMDANIGKAKGQLKTSSDYFDNYLLLETTRDEDEAVEEDRDEVQIDNLKGRTRYWAFGGFQFKHHRLGMKGKCFIVQPKQWEVVIV